MDAVYLEYIAAVVSESGADTLVLRDDAGLTEYDGLTVILLSSGELYDARVIEFRSGEQVVARARLP